MPNRTVGQPLGNRYAKDVLAQGWQQQAKKVVPEIALERGMVLEDATTGFCGAVTRWENGLVVLEGRDDKRRSFPIGHGLLLEGKPVAVTVPPRRPAGCGGWRDHRAGRRRARSPVRPSGPRWHCPAGSTSRVGTTPSWSRRSGATTCATSAWWSSSWTASTTSLTIVAEFRPERGRRLGVLADHLVPGSKESRIAAGVAKGPYGAYVLVAGHPFIDIWQAVKPADWGCRRGPTCRAAPTSSTAPARRWVGRTATKPTSGAPGSGSWPTSTSWSDLERGLLTPVEQLIDFVTQDHIS